LAAAARLTVTVGSDPEIERLRLKKLDELVLRRREEEKEQARVGNGKPVELTDETFGTIRNYPLMLVDFWAPWCGPCRMVSPIVEDLAREYQGRVWFGKVNVDENPETAGRFGIQSIPSLLLFKQGAMVDEIVGAVPRHVIESRIRAHMEDLGSRDY
jgi:thioredoxin